MIITLTVFQKSILAEEKQGYTMRQVDATCLIDGEMYQYIYKRDSLNSNKTWRDQASSFAHYDAKNRGSNVSWRVTNRPGRKATKSNPNQKELF